MKKILAADLFCGAGGASTGFIRACEDVGLDYDLLAINHWTTAVKTHALNHPGVRHLCESLERVDPREQVPCGRLHVLLAGPECTHFSTARGGRPVNPQSRASAWHIAKWAQELYIDTILIENVPEFRTWGPVGADGKPLKSKKGETFKAFLGVLQSLGYRVDVKILNAADYGDPTTRQRLFIMARRGKHQIRWPEPTHSKTGDSTLFGGRRRWTPARQVIDWGIKGKSIFNRKKPLRPATVARIVAGLEKFGGEDLKPFLVVLRNHGAGRSLDAPVPTLAANGQHVGLAEPFLMHMTHGGRLHSMEQPVPTLTTARRGEIGVVESFVLPQHGGGALRPTEQPLPTIATDGAIAVVEPCIVQTNERRAERVGSVDEPLKTITALGGRCFGLAEPFLVPMYGEREGQAPRTHSVDEPVPVIPATGGGKFGVVEPYLTKYYGSGDGVSPVSDPTPTVTTRDRFALVEPFIVGAGGPQYGGAPRTVEQPMGTVLSREHKALVEPFLASYYGQKDGQPRVSSIDEPIPTIPTENRFALVQPVINGLALDIHFRMLQPHELAAAMSFPKTYKFTGTREEVVKQIGNSWAGELSKALCKAAVQDFAPARRRRSTSEAVA